MRFPLKLLLYATMLLFVIAGAHAETQGAGVLCDSEAQVRALAKAGGGPDGILAVNATAPNACAWVVVRFIEPQVIGRAEVGNRLLTVVQCTVLAFYVNGVWYELAPSPQYALADLGDEI